MPGFSVVPNSCGRDVLADQRGAVEVLGQLDRLEDADDREPLAAEPHLHAVGHVGDAEALGRVGRRARRRGGRSRASSSHSPSASSARSVPEQRRVGGLHGDAARSGCWGRGPCGGRRRRPRSPTTRPARGRCGRASPRRSSAGRHRRRRTRSPRRPGRVSRLVPRRSSEDSRSLRDDSEMPRTATIAAMPMAMPSADSAARRRRLRSPTDATRKRSPGCSALRGSGGPVTIGSRREDAHRAHADCDVTMIVLDATVAHGDLAGQASRRCPGRG